MILDHDLQFSDSQKITETCTSERALSLGTRGGQNLITVLATVTQGLVCTGDGGTMTISIESADAEDFTDASIHATSGELALSLLKRGSMPMCIALPQGCGDFVRLKYAVAMEAGATITAGSVSSSLVLDVPVLF